MKFAAYLEKKQPFVWRTFVHSFQAQRLSHAYLLSGEVGAPLKETALFLAKSLLCDHPNPLACEECRSCLRVDHLTYSDLLILDGEKASIKKDDVQAVVGDFSRTPLEEKGVMIYIIHLVENMTVEAVNSLLKFLEEPAQNTYAILTTQNEARILPTIISRCECLRMLLSPRSEVIAEALALGVGQDDAELLSYFDNAGELIALESKSDDYQQAKAAFTSALAALAKPRSGAVFDFERSVIPAVPKKEDGRYFLDMLSLAFKDLLALKEKRPIALASYATLLEPLNRLPHLSESLLEIMKARSQLDLNISVSLLLEHLVNYLTKEF